MRMFIATNKLDDRNLLSEKIKHQVVVVTTSDEAIEYILEKGVPDEIVFCSSETDDSFGFADKFVRADIDNDVIHQPVCFLAFDATGQKAMYYIKEYVDFKSTFNPGDMDE